MFQLSPLEKQLRDCINLLGSLFFLLANVLEFFFFFLLFFFGCLFRGPNVSGYAQILVCKHVRRCSPTFWILS